MDHYNYCPNCRMYCVARDVRVFDEEVIHDVRRGGCGFPVFDCTEEEYWGLAQGELEGVEGGNAKGINNKGTDGSVPS